MTRSIQREAAATVSVIGGGWSLRGVDLSRVPGVVIAVNDSAILAPRVDFAVSMDRLWTEHRWDRLRARCEAGEVKAAYLRRSALSRIPDPWPRWCKAFDCDHTTDVFSYVPGHRLASQMPRLNGGNSGTCALNLAYHFEPKRVLMFGFDMCRSPKGEAYWYAPYPWTAPAGATTGGKYRAWAQTFDVVARRFQKAGVEVLNCSLHSQISDFPKIDPRSVLE